MSNAKVFKLTGIACQSQLISCSSAEPDAWVLFSEHCEEVIALKRENAFLKTEVERLYRHGDLMLKFAAANMPYPAYATMAKDWNAAKEGKPSV